MTTRWGDEPDEHQNTHTDQNQEVHGYHQSRRSVPKRPQRDNDDRRAKFQRNDRGDNLMQGRYNNNQKQHRNPPLHRRLDDLEDRLRDIRAQNDEILVLLCAVHTNTNTIISEELVKTDTQHFSEDDNEDYSPTTVN